MNNNQEHAKTDQNLDPASDPNLGIIRFSDLEEKDQKWLWFCETVQAEGCDPF